MSDRRLRVPEIAEKALLGGVCPNLGFISLKAYRVVERRGNPELSEIARQKTYIKFYGSGNQELLSRFKV